MQVPSTSTGAKIDTNFQLLLLVEEERKSPRLRPTKIMHIAFFYAALLGLLFVGLTVRTLRLRRRLRISIGDRGNESMLRAVRVHSNFAEYAPLGLLLIYFDELSGATTGFVHLLGLSLLIGRAIHAYGVGRLDEDYRYRVTGMALTIGVLVTASLRLLYAYAVGIAT